MNRPMKTRSELCKGKSINLQTTFDGLPAPGGSYYPESNHYVKRCKMPNAGRHPKLSAFGGIDSEVVRELTRRKCRTMELLIGDEPPRFCTFEDFLGKGFPVHWRDSRFDGPRHYLNVQFWFSSSFRLRLRQNELIQEKQQTTERVRQLQLMVAI